MKIIKKFLCVVYVFVLCFCICSCYDASEVEETAYVIAFGIDKGNNGNLYTFQLAAPLGSSSAEEIGAFSENDGEESEAEEDEIIVSNNKSVKNIVVSAQDFYSAKSLLTNFLSKNLSFSHLKMIVFSYEAVSDTLAEHIDLFSKEMQICPTAFVAVSKDGAESYLKSVNPELEASTAKYYELSNSKKKLVYAPSKTLKDFMKESNSRGKSAVLPLAVIKKTKNSAELSEAAGGDETETLLSSSKAEMFGMAIFKNEKPVGEAGGKETVFYNVLTGQTKNIVYPFELNGERKFARLSFVNTPRFKLSGYKNDGGAEVKIKLNLEYTGSGNENEKEENEIKDFALKIFKTDLELFLKRIANEYKADIFNIGALEQRRYKTVYEMKNASFDDFLENCLFTVDLKVCKN